MLREFDGAVSTLRPILETAPEYCVGPLVQRVGEIAEMAGTTGSATEPTAAYPRDAAIDFQKNSPPKQLPGSNH